MSQPPSLAEVLEEAWFGINQKSRGLSATHTSSEYISAPDVNANNTNNIHVSASEPNLKQSKVSPANQLPRRLPRRRASSADLSDPKSSLSGKQAPPGKPPRPDAPGRASSRTAIDRPHRYKDFAERRRAWRARLDAANSARRLYTVEIPGAAPRSMAPSVQSTPAGSPKTQGSFLNREETPSPTTNNNNNNKESSPTLHSIPAVWIGHSADQAPKDFASLTDQELRLFLQQSGSTCMPPPEADTESLVTAAQACKSNWEVERILFGCTDPADILRVPRGVTDLAILKAAWKKVAIQIHPDKCHAPGAADAMAIARDAFDLLQLQIQQKTPQTPYSSSLGGGVSDAEDTAGIRSDNANRSTQTASPHHVSSVASDLNSLDGGEGNPSNSNNISAPPYYRVRVKVKAAAPKNSGNKAPP